MDFYFKEDVEDYRKLVNVGYETFKLHILALIDDDCEYLGSDIKDTIKKMDLIKDEKNEQSEE